VSQRRTAFAKFTGRRIDRDHWKWYGAIVDEWVPVDGSAATRFGGVFRGTCERTRRSDGTSISCHGRGLRMDEDDSFTMDELASEATLDVRDESGHHRVTWTATDDRPGWFWSESACNAGSGVGAGLVNKAIADGHVFGSHYRTKPSFRHWNALWGGGNVSQCRFLSERDLADLMDGGGFTIHRAF
jgi:hypothetical protein